MTLGVDPFSDSALAVAVARGPLDARFIHVHGLGWLAYNGHVWEPVPTKDVIDAVRAWIADQLVDAAERYRAGTTSKETVTGWNKASQSHRIKAVVELASGIDGVNVKAQQLDSYPDLLNTPSGVVDLRTGHLKDSQPWYYFTKVTGCEFDPKAVHPDWDAALTALPESVLTWYQTRCGQGITGHMPDDRAIVQQGGGANGKSTVMAAIAAALGDYYLPSTERLLLPAGRDAMAPEVADLRGARFVAIEETPETGRLDTQRLKALVGTPTIMARKLYQDYITFTATHSIFLNTNFTPIVNETDHGTWRRLLLVVFPYTFVKDPLDESERQGDPGLRARLRGEEQRRAVLAWLVAGAVRWYREGFGDLPAIVDSDTADWRAQTDHVASFWDEHLAADPDAFIPVSDMMRAFNAFMRDTGHVGIAEGTFSRRFATHPATKEAGVYKAVVRISDRTRTTMSRPNRDEWKTLPPIPDGTAKSWKGVRFRHEGMLDTP